MIFFDPVHDTMYAVTLQNNAGQPIGYSIEQSRAEAAQAARELWAESGVPGDRISFTSIGVNGTETLELHWKTDR